MTLSHYRHKLERAKGTRQHIARQLTRAKGDIKRLEAAIIDTEEAQAIIQQVAKETQEQFQYHISELCTLAMSAVFDNPYEVQVEFAIRRGQTEVDIFFVRDGIKLEPIMSDKSVNVGGGAINVGAFGLREAMLSLSRPRPRNVLLTDEPFHRIKGIDDNVRAIQMVKEISEQMSQQVIMISDERVPMGEIEKGADRVFRVVKRGGVSEVEVL